MKRVALALIAPRSRRLSWCYLVLVLPILFLAVGGYTYGGFVFYSILVMIVVGQFLYPTLLGWSVTALFFAVATALYSYVLARDIVYLSMGRRPQALVNLEDTVGFLILLAVVAGLLALAIKIRPGLRKP